MRGVVPARGVLAALSQQALQLLDVGLAALGAEDGEGDEAHHGSAHAGERHLHVAVLQLIGGGTFGVVHEVLRLATVSQLIQGASQLAAGALDVALDVINVACHVYLLRFLTSFLL